MFLLIPNYVEIPYSNVTYLHSTMFLLIPEPFMIYESSRYDLHSTMFLLILIAAVCPAHH